MVKHLKKLIFAALGLAGIGLLLISSGLTVTAAPLAQLTPFFTPTPGPDGRIIYVVQEQDTLWRISAITGVPLDTLRALNKLGANDTISPGEKLLIGLAGPALGTATPGPSPMPTTIPPTSTPMIGTGDLCVLLYNDQNGDAIRQESEPSLAEGAISVTNPNGSVSLTANTEAGTDPKCFPALPEAQYNVTVAIPDGYNPTTVLSKSVKLISGDTTYVSFGAQANSVKEVETQVIPQPPGRSPMLAIIGGLLLLGGAGLGLYVAVMGKKK